MRIGKRLRGLRCNVGVSLGHMARKLSMSRAEIIAIENGDVECDESMLDAYRDALGMDVNR